MSRAMFFVLHKEKKDIIVESDALEAAARAALFISYDVRRYTLWAKEFDLWLDGKWRKITKRAKGKDWAGIQKLAGVTLKVRTAELRVLVPMEISQSPTVIAKLQVAGLELPMVENAVKEKYQIAISPYLEMSTGKKMAQAGHGSMALANRLSAQELSAWQKAGFPLSIIFPNKKEWDELREKATVVIRDAGFTEIAAGSETVLGYIDETK